MTRRRKPHDPAAAARLAAERDVREAEIQRLISMGATVTVDPARRIVSAWRSNVFNLLLTRKAINQNQFIAAYTLSLDWAAWKGLDGRAEGSAEFVDGGTGCRELVTDRMLAAGATINGNERRIGVLQQLEPADRKLIEAFMVATVEEDRPMSWRGIVQRIHGDQLGKPGEVAVVVRALESLRCVYEAPRERRAA